MSLDRVCPCCGESPRASPIPRASHVLFGLSVLVAWGLLWGWVGLCVWFIGGGSFQWRLWLGGTLAIGVPLAVMSVALVWDT